MRRALLLVLLVFFAIQAGHRAYADTPAAKHTAFGEFFGAGLGFMANYDHRLSSWLSLRGGLGFSFSTGIGDGEYGNIVMSAHGLYALSGPHHLEASPGLGGLVEFGGDRTAKVASLLGGYRYQKRDGGMFARIQIGLGIVSRPDKDTKTVPLFGLAIGWTLRNAPAR